MPSYSGVWTLPAQLQAIGSQNWTMAPGAPTSVSATAGDAQATVSFTAPTFVGIPPPITGYRAISSPGGLTATGASSPLTVTGLSNGTAYTFNVQATNSVGYGAAGTSGSVTPAAVLALFFGGYTGTGSNVIDQINISTTGNATDFGDLLQIPTNRGLYNTDSAASSTRGIISAGNGDIHNISYVTFASAGDAQDFGDLNFVSGDASGAIFPTAGGNSTRGLLTATPSNYIRYITIATTGDALTFGNLSASRTYGCKFSSTTRSVFAGGSDPSNVIDYVTTASTGNATDFGDLTVARGFCAGAGSSTRGLVAGGYTSTWVNIIDYVTIASVGNAIDFGDLTRTASGITGSSSSTRAVFGGGENGSGSQNIIDYVTIASAGNATDFGDLTLARYNLSGSSNGHGGL